VLLAEKLVSVNFKILLAADEKFINAFQGFQASNASSASSQRRGNLTL